MRLPDSNSLPVNLLAACFNKTVATYKFYWFLSIIQEIENGNFLIQKRNLFARMISNAWYTVNYFRVSFGKQDLIQDAVYYIKEMEKITINEEKKIIFQKLSSTKNQSTVHQLWHFNNNVPHWFLSPWFPKKVKSEIYYASKTFSENCLYALHNEIIEINSEWIEYLTSNARVLKDFCYWNLTLFLQAKNPNVPDIPNKLIKPATRKNLNNQRKYFWDLVVQERGSVKCIYTGNDLKIGNYAIDHFIPHSFASHNLIWNLIPSDIPFNIFKGNKLPPLEIYFDSFFKLQKEAVEIVSTKLPKNKLLEDYLTIFPDLDNSFTEEKFRETIQPLITIASNNGFEYLR
jgi:hypothetical protein